MIICSIIQMGSGGGSGMWGFGFLWPLVSLLLVGVIVIGAVYLVTEWMPARESRDVDRALTTLREQYARGEVTEEDFENRRKRLLERE